MNILGTLRASYLYAALTIAGGAIVIAAMGLLALGLELAGLRSTPPSPESIREQISGAVAVFIFAIPVGAIHLWLVLRSLDDPNERRSGPRHLFLNAWIVAGLLMVVTSIFGIADTAIVRQTKELAFPISSVLAGIAIALVGWRWREATPGTRRLWQLIAAFATLGLATALMVTEIFPLMGALMNALLEETSYYRTGYFPPRDVVWSSLVGLVAAFGMWSIGLRWQWPWRDVTFRTIYAAAGYGLGLALVAVPGSDALARAIGLARGGVQLAELRGIWEVPVIGLVLVVMHLPWLLSDRGRISYPERVTDRIVRGVTALGGLAALTLAATAWGSVIVQDWLRIGPAQDDPLRVRDQAVATLLLGVVLYPLPWWGFLRATVGDPRSGLRRAYVLFVTCVSLLGAIVAGVVAATNLIQMALGATLSSSVVRDTVDAAGWLVIFAVVIAVHLWLLLRDMRAAKAMGPRVVAPRSPTAADPILAILQGVSTGLVAPGEAALRIRAILADERVSRPTGRTA